MIAERRLKKYKMKFNFKKIASVLTGGLMVASTIGFAAAATLPAPFDSGSAIVYGAAGNVQVDMAAAVNIQTAIGKVAGGITDAGIPEGSWQVETSSDKFEIGEAIRNVTTYIGSEDLPILADAEISNEKGTAKYEQFFYFDDFTSSAVSYLEDDDENVGLFFKVNSGQVIARYVMDFTTNLESDVTTASALEDIDDEEITILGKTYTIITATNSTTNTDLTLMSGANKVTISNGEELTVGGKTLSVVVSGTNAAQFTVDGQTTSKLTKGETTKLDDGTYLGVSEITYQDFAGGLMQATVYVGADKLEFKDGSSLVVNGETISNAAVTISETWSSDVSIDTITINMTAEDDLYVPVGGKLSAATDLDEPQVLISQNWDIMFSGLADATYETLELKKSTDSKIVLDFENFNGDKISTPLMYTNTSGVYGGDKQGYGLVLNASDSSRGIAKNEYFILNTADPTLAANSGNARSYVVQYKGADKVTDTSPKVKFDVIGVDSSKEVTVTTAGASSLKLGGTTFNFANVSAGSSDDFPIYLTGGDWADITPLNNGSSSNYVRTKGNALVNITDTNASSFIGAASGGQASNWIVNVTLDDTNRDGDNYALSSGVSLFAITYSNNSDGEFGTALSSGKTASWISDPNDNTKSSYIDSYGNEFEFSNPSSAPDSVIVKIPSGVVEPKVYVTSGAVTVAAGTTAAGGLAPIVDDSKIATVQNKNLVVVGGSCINKVAAKLLGSDAPLCGADFTAKTNVGAGSYIIDTFASPYTAGKVAMLVAGYEGTDTVAAAQKVVDDKLSPDVATAPIIGPVIA